MSPQHANFPAEGCGATTLFLWGLGRLRIQDGLQIAVAETVDQEFAVVDRFQEGAVLAEGLEGPDTALLPFGGLLYIRN